jgi:phosphohistidine phosphatase
VRVILLRHGIAVDRSDPDCPADPDRPLTEEGIDRTKAAARGLRAMGVRPGLVLTSPYVRAVQTAQIACAALGAPPPRRSDAFLPSADPARAAGLLRECAEEEVLCAGHEPHLSLLLAHLVAGRPGAAAFAPLKKAGAALVETGSPGAEPGELAWLLPSRVLRTLGEEA